jgi:alpha,alpha-trehalose phosphorylase
LLVDDEPFDVRYGTLKHHERVLDLRDGVLRRSVEWVSPANQAVRIHTTRLVSFVQRAIVAIHYEVEPLEAPARIVLQSSLVANEPVPEQTDDPRAAAALRAPLVSEYDTYNQLEVALGHRTRLSDLRLAAAMTHVIDSVPGTVVDAESEADLARVNVSTELAPGQKLTVVKLLAYGWSSGRSMPALRDQVDAALAAAKRTGWDGLVAGQRAYLDDVWGRADVGIEGDPALQQAVRYALFQVIQAGARAEQRAIPAKGLTGRGYDGHTFWDMETYVLPVLTYTAPDAARDALRWRQSTLPSAKARARELRLAGASFPWRTIRGEECSGYWPAGTAAFHMNADIADAVRRYIIATGDAEFERGAGVDLLIETARLWASLGHHDAEGRFRIDGVTGPDEYTALADNNVFTNLMAARTLKAAAAAASRHPRRAAELGVNCRRDGRLEHGSRARGRAVRPRARRDIAVRRVYPLSTMGFRRDTARSISAPPALPLLPAVFQSGGQAGRSRLRAVPVWRLLRPRTEASGFPLLRSDYGARLVTVGIRTGDRRGRDRPSRLSLQLSSRNCLRGSLGPGWEYTGWSPSGRTGWRMAGCGCRVWRSARPRRHPCAEPSIARAAQ